jgi:hypothetical protein
MTYYSCKFSRPTASSPPWWGGDEERQALEGRGGANSQAAPQAALPEKPLHPLLDAVPFLYTGVLALLFYVDPVNRITGTVSCGRWAPSPSRAPCGRDTAEGREVGDVVRLDN